MQDKEKLRIIVLAAGKGTRMKSPNPKVLAELKGQPMISHLLESIDKSGLDAKPIVVVGYEKELVIKKLGKENKQYEYVTQEEQLGTGHAVYVTKDACKDVKNIIVISGDQPFIKPETIKKLYRKHLESDAKITITTTTIPNFNNEYLSFLKFGRIIRKDNKIIDKEFKDATDEEKNIKELNVSCYVFDANWLWENFKKIRKDTNIQQEYYLTDLWEIASTNGDKIESIQVEPYEALGANSKEELEILEKLMIQ